MSYYMIARPASARNLFGGGGGIGGGGGGEPPPNNNNNRGPQGHYTPPTGWVYHLDGDEEISSQTWAQIFLNCLNTGQWGSESNWNEIRRSNALTVFAQLRQTFEQRWELARQSSSQPGQVTRFMQENLWSMLTNRIASRTLPRSLQERMRQSGTVVNRLTDQFVYRFTQSFLTMLRRALSDVNTYSNQIRSDLQNQAYGTEESKDAQFQTPFDEYDQQHTIHTQPLLPPQPPPPPDNDGIWPAGDIPWAQDPNRDRNNNDGV